KCVPSRSAPYEPDFNLPFGSAAQRLDYRVATTAATACWIAAAHSPVSFAFFPFAAFLAAFAALASRCFACRRRRVAVFDFVAASARSSRPVARSSFFVTDRGTLSSPHATPWRAASSVQRGVVQGSVVVLVVVLTIVVVVGTTTLVSAAKFSSPGVPVLTARTVSASDVPVATSAGGW